MTCTWCPNEAVEGGQAPAGVSGLRYIAACGTHRSKIEKLKYTPIKPSEIEGTLKREAKEAAKK